MNPKRRMSITACTTEVNRAHDGKVGVPTYEKPIRRHDGFCHIAPGTKYGPGFVASAAIEVVTESLRCRVSNGTLTVT